MRWWLLVCLLLPACGQDSPQGFYIKEISGFTDPERDKLDEAILQINSVSHANVLSESSGNKPLYIRREHLSGTNTGEAQIGIYNCKIKLDPDNQLIQADLNNLKYVLVHQLGHCGGIPYSSDPDSVMYPTFSGSYDAAAETKIINFIPVLKQALE